MHLKPISFAALFFLSACASHPEDIERIDVSTEKYQTYNCDQLSTEADRISSRTQELYTDLKEKADTDSVQMGVGLALFLPTLFFLEGGDGPEAQEYAHLKGEHKAIEIASLEKNCGIAFEDAAHNS